MNKKLINFKIDGKEYAGYEGETILDVARRNNIFIPTLCEDKNLNPQTSCFLCIADLKNAKSLQPTCATKIFDGLEVTLTSKEIVETRKSNLELLLSNHFADCYAPCKLACPANVDVQGYIALGKRKQFKEAIKLIKESIPMPVTIGRVCPRPCEDACRRNYIDKPVAIDDIKRYIADKDIFSDNPYKPEMKKNTGKKIAIIGSGPAGLSCAYYSRINGHQVDIYERMPKPGGMLRYGIPSYRLDKNVLDKEINLILSLGINIYYNKTFGKDFTYKDLFDKGYDAIFIAIGAQKGSSLKTEGTHLKNVISAVDFLRDVQFNKYDQLTGTVYVIGGGNTAIDAARTSLRLGAKKVIIAYRRTEHEMPANKEEIEEAKEEGIEIRTLVNPTRYIGNGNLEKIEFIKMELGEPDNSGRRRPIPVVGSEFIEDADYVIEAIGQKIDTAGLEEFEKEKKGWIIVNPETFETSIKGVFSGGDCVVGPDIVVTALAHGRKAAYSIDQYLKTGETKAEDRLKFYIRRDDFRDITEKDYQGFEKIERNQVHKLEPEKRKNSFKEFNYGFTEDDFEREVDRCLECGCQDVNECKLREYSYTYNVDKTLFFGEHKEIPYDDSHPYILKEHNKCINCGKCIEVCKEITGLSIWGFYGRGFTTKVTTKWNIPLNETYCVSCGNCISVCPVGALTEKQISLPMGPFKNEKVSTVCTGCGELCDIDIEFKGELPVKVVSDKTLCYIGKFSWENQYINSKINLDKKSGNYFSETINNKIKDIKESKNLLFLNPFYPIEYYESLKKYFINSKFLSFEIIKDVNILNIFVQNNIDLLNTDKSIVNKFNNFVIFDKISDNENAVFYYNLFKKGCNFYVNKEELNHKHYKEAHFIDISQIDFNSFNYNDSLLILNPSNISDFIIKDNKDRKKESIHNLIIKNLTSFKNHLIIYKYPNYLYLLDFILKQDPDFLNQVEYNNIILFNEKINNLKIQSIFNFNNIIRFEYFDNKFPIDHFFTFNGHIVSNDLKIKKLNPFRNSFVSYDFFNISKSSINEKLINNLINSIKAEQFVAKLEIFNNYINKNLETILSSFEETKIY